MCVAAGRAQESRQDISLSGTALIEPFIASSTDVYVHSNRPPMARWSATASCSHPPAPSRPTTASPTRTRSTTDQQHQLVYQVLTRNQEISVAYVRSFNFRKYNPFVEAGPGVLIFLPIRNSGTTTLRRQAADPDRRPSMAPASLARSAPASTFAPSIAASSPRCPTSTTPS